MSKSLLELSGKGDPSLVEDMMDNHAANGNAFEECLQFLEALKAGIQES